MIQAVVDGPVTWSRIAERLIIPGAAIEGGHEVAPALERGEIQQYGEPARVPDPRA
ncbi:hypothetical protein [Streptomyces collinus]|uniref:hypothetical protein n=1 Tax=Streptomyces collinus TaxID=42684 RepID=UPI0036E86861